MTDDVLRCADVVLDPILSELRAWGLQPDPVAAGRPIPGSYWGDSEAGLIGNRLYYRGDTPVHSLLHEACHWRCMDSGRRAVLNTDAGGDDIEENAVCYLQILLAGSLPGLDRQRMLDDMDRWGYSFRLGTARAWFEHDADDARAWLSRHDLLPEGAVSAA